MRVEQQDLFAGTLELICLKDQLLENPEESPDMQQQLLQAAEATMQSERPNENAQRIAAFTSKYAIMLE